MRYAHTNRDAKKRAVGLIAGNGAKFGDSACFEDPKGLVTVPGSDWEIR